MKWPEDLFLRFFISGKCGKNYTNKKLWNTLIVLFAIILRYYYNEILSII